MIVNRFDANPSDGIGVASLLLDTGDYEWSEKELLFAMLSRRRQTHGDGVVMIDGGANIGAITVSLAQAIEPWGGILAFEMQERIFYALCGNVALNNLWNVRAKHAALGKDSGHTNAPLVDHSAKTNFGGISLRPENNNGVAQKLEYTETVRVQAIDDMKLPRLDVLKLDVEGMEQEVIDGGWATITRDKPMILAEWTFQKFAPRLPEGYRVHRNPLYAVCMAADELLWQNMKIDDAPGCLA